MKHAEEDPNSTQRVNWKQKISEEKKKTHITGAKTYWIPEHE